MKIVEPSFEILYPVTHVEWVREFEMIEFAGRTAYKSEEHITKGSYVKFIEGLINRNHMAVLEFGNMIVKFVTDRGISHELVRHRLCSFVQESTRYCNYNQDKFGNEISFIKPSNLDKTDVPTNTDQVWEARMQQLEDDYLNMLKWGLAPQTVRAMLPTCVKTEIIIKANFREWIHIFNLRVLGKTGKPHPDMMRLMTPLYHHLNQINSGAYQFVWNLGPALEEKNK